MEPCTICANFLYICSSFQIKNFCCLKKNSWSCSPCHLEKTLHTNTPVTVAVFHKVSTSELLPFLNAMPRECAHTGPFPRKPGPGLPAALVLVASPGLPALVLRVFFVRDTHWDLYNQRMPLEMSGTLPPYPLHNQSSQAAHPNPGDTAQQRLLVTGTGSCGRRLRVPAQP